MGLNISSTANWGVSDPSTMTFNEQGAMARMSSPTFDAINSDLNGAGTYGFIDSIDYHDGAVYHMRMEVDVEFNEFNLYGTREGETEEFVIGEFYGFRRGSDTVDYLSIWQSLNNLNDDGTVAQPDHPYVIIDNIVLTGDFTSVDSWSLF